MESSIFVEGQGEMSECEIAGKLEPVHIMAVYATRRHDIEVRLRCVRVLNMGGSEVGWKNWFSD